MTTLKVVRLSKQARLPTKGSESSAGYNLYSAVDFTIPSDKQEVIKTDISIRVPVGTYGRLAPRSGLALNHQINVMAGVVDRDYNGEVKVILFNHGAKVYHGKKGDKVCQLILEKIADATVEEVEVLDETLRGEAGFGSTGR